MAQETLFQILLRQPWWVTLLVACGMFGVAYWVFPPVAPFFALPFVVLSGYIAYTQWGTGAPSDAGERLTAIRAMSWETFSGTVIDAYRRQGYEVTPSDGSGFDFKLSKDGRLTLLQCRRWKVNQVGAAPVRELADAVDRSEAYQGVCLAAGEFSEPARKVAAGEPVNLIGGPDLVELLARARKKRLWRFVR
jgi:restriction system protein